MKSAQQTESNWTEPTNEPLSQIAQAVAIAQQAFLEGSKAAEAVGDCASQVTQDWVEQAAEMTGNTLASLAQNPILKFATDKLGMGWLKAVLGGVNSEKVIVKVETLQRKHPQASPRAIAHRLVLDKAMSAAGVGIFTNIIPPIAAALLGIELVATTRMQAEMVHEIAAAYGLDLQEPKRRGEVLAIFGLALGADALKLGLGVVELIPGVGIVVGASSNALLFYALGQAAIRFYEAKLNEPVKESELQVQSQADLENLIAQRQIMDRVLVNMVMATYPDQSWESILPELRASELSPDSIDAIAACLEDSQPLDQLLKQLNPEFAKLLLVRCQQIAQLNGETSSAEAEILAAVRCRSEESQAQDPLAADLPKQEAAAGE